MEKRVLRAVNDRPYMKYSAFLYGRRSASRKRDGKPVPYNGKVLPA